VSEISFHPYGKAKATATSTRGRARLPSRKLIWVSRIVGFLFPFNLYIIPWLDQTPRFTDLFAFAVLVVILVVVTIRKEVYWEPTYRAYGLLVLLLPMVWHGVLMSGITPLVLPTRYAVAILAGIGVWYLVGRGRTRSAFFKSLILGAVCCSIIPLLQWFGYLALTQQLGLAAQDVVAAKFFGGTVWRVPGMEKHVNGSAVIVGLGVPCALGLADEKRGNLSWLLLALLGLLVASAVTLNRASVIASGVLLILWFMLSRSSGVKTWQKIVILTLLVGAAIWIEPPGGWGRWQQLQNLQDYNGFKVRLETFIHSFDMLMKNPMGVGKEYETMLAARTGHTASHNAILQIGLLAGLPFAVFMTAKLLLLSFYIPLRGGFAEGWIAAYLMGIFFFEEYLAIPTLVAIVVWLMIVPLGKILRAAS